MMFNRVEISVLENGIAWVGSEGSTFFAWEMVRKIEAIQQDQLTYDEVCLVIEVNGHRITIPESHAAWKALLEILPRKFALREAAWLEKVAFPPLAQNRFLLFLRD